MHLGKKNLENKIRSPLKLLYLETQAPTPTSPCAKSICAYYSFLEKHHGSSLNQGHANKGCTQKMQQNYQLLEIMFKKGMQGVLSLAA